MERRTNIQGDIATITHPINRIKPSIGFDRSLLSRNLYPSNKYIAQSVGSINNISMIDRKYSDLEFLPIPENIIRDNERTSYDDLEYKANVARWLRPEQIQWPKEAQPYRLSVFNQPHPKDIIQGCLGNCWLISALSAIAEMPQLLYKVMITKEYSPAGLYQVRLCNRGIWQVITIDDMLPVTKSNSLVFTRSQKKQLFPSLIEKALAKMHGSYKALELGRCVEGLQILTGEPCEVFCLQPTDPKKKPDLNHLWNEIIQSRAKGYLMTCLSSNIRLDEEIFNRMGLELDHAYSILDARQIASRRLVCLRNPWGKKQSTNWPTNLGGKLASSSENDGIFWMPWEAMSVFFSEITICQIRANKHEARKSGQFSDFSSRTTSVYSLHCPYGAELGIELFNQSDQKYNNRLKDPDIDLFLIVLCSNGSCKGYKHSLDYYITLSIRVPPGQYMILAGSMSVVNYSINPRFNLIVHGDHVFSLHEQTSSYGLVGNAFHAVALRANNRKDFGDGVSILTFNDNGGFGFVCENKCNRPIRLTSDFQGSTNIFSSRKTLRMIDTIPAKTKQLFSIFTRKVLSENVNIVYQVEYQTLNELPGVDHIRARNNPPLPFQALGLHILKPVHGIP